MNNEEKQVIKNNILEYLTEDKRGHRAIFDIKEGYAVWDRTTLFDVMDCVVKGLQKSQKLLNKRK